MQAMFNQIHQTIIEAFTIRNLRTMTKLHKKITKYVMIIKQDCPGTVPQLAYTSNLSNPGLIVFMIGATHFLQEYTVCPNQLRPVLT